eukprot:TRINITY_DN12261_c0_g2_i1.p3 TRINITY_DN12261_c0_g2~~TRINITY_DN12261_c0_g2_i1.p3  ORF type:complete len:448 (+),score=17.82 TRINITY_DN12261_c0_g2_i1:3638-4981(+)
METQLILVIALCIVCFIALVIIFTLLCQLNRTGVTPSPIFDLINDSELSSKEPSPKGTAKLLSNQHKTLRSLPTKNYDVYSPSAFTTSPISTLADEILLCVRHELPYLPRPENMLYIVTTRLLANMRPAAPRVIAFSTISGSQGLGFALTGSMPCRIGHVTPGSPAALAGARVDDVLVEICGHVCIHSTHQEIIRSLTTEIQRYRTSMDETEIRVGDLSSTRPLVMDDVTLGFETPERKNIPPALEVATPVTLAHQRKASELIASGMYDEASRVLDEALRLARQASMKTSTPQLANAKRRKHQLLPSKSKPRGRGILKKPEKTGWSNIPSIPQASRDRAHTRDSASPVLTFKPIEEHKPMSSDVKMIRPVPIRGQAARQLSETSPLQPSHAPLAEHFGIGRIGSAFQTCHDDMSDLPSEELDSDESQPRTNTTDIQSWLEEDPTNIV